jgi:hypothetical protein
MSSRKKAIGELPLELGGSRGDFLRSRARIRRTQSAAPVLSSGLMTEPSARLVSSPSRSLQLALGAAAAGDEVGLPYRAHEQFRVLAEVPGGRRPGRRWSHPSIASRGSG